MKTLITVTLVIIGLSLFRPSFGWSADNCTWHYFDQPLSHFSRGSTGGKGFKQRLCVYDKFWSTDNSPVFFYTGNESPVEEYVNNSGFMWSLAERYGALVVFAEHRYFGESVPEIYGLPSCMSYLSSQEALADYIAVINYLRRERGAASSPVVAFGGSYGGMLASWMRILYPSSVDGAIAASAPILGFPLDGCPLDSSARAVTGAASELGGASEGCADNLKAAYVLISDIGKTSDGRSWLTNELNLCTSLQSTTDVDRFLVYLQSPLFNLAEGSYPFSSDYITFALTGTNDPLPAWPLRVMCEPIGDNFGIQISGNTTAVQFTVSAGNKVEVYVDWDQTKNNGYSLDSLKGTYVVKLLTVVAEGVQIWYNVSGNLPACIDWDQTAPNSLQSFVGMRNNLPQKVKSFLSEAETSILVDNQQTDKCTFPSSEFDASMGWFALTCNEGLNLINWWAQGVGNDLYWPPNQKLNYSLESLVPSSMLYCSTLNSLGLKGTPEKVDTWSIWDDNVYGGTRLKYATNIVFSNGNLDPWYPAGVSSELLLSIGTDSTVVSILIDQGGHHVDLFEATEEDPDSVINAREVEEAHIREWIGA